ncbi:MAG: hypothetical protein GC192_21465 [Bacteroidetes bacterium]|nr:hypothetical protein [Bacteroidota bacterium]
MATTIQELIKAELDYGWIDSSYQHLASKGWKAIEIKESIPKELSIHLNKGFIFHTEGRLEIHQKVAFISNAQKEVVEFGVTLNTFASYFNSRRDGEYKTHVEELLNRGVNFKCYLLDPESNEASVYFDDRRREQDNEIINVEPIRDAIRKLANIKKTIDAKSFIGKFEVFTYKHIPYNYFMIVDGNTPNGGMMVSHYLYGIQRAKCPVWEFNKSHNHEMYRRYWESYQKLIKGARPISDRAKQ